jgi:hypothetical protein
MEIAPWDSGRSGRDLFVAIGSIIIAAAACEAYAAAPQRAAIGASPKPSAHTKEIYEQAFLNALG